jgi:serine/threonine-protein kinase RsbW
MALPRNQIRIHARLEDIRTAIQFVREAGQRAGLDDRALHHCQLAVDEACTNIIEHNYEPDQGDLRINIRCGQDAQVFWIEVVDSGRAFDPLQQAAPDPTINLAERQHGGWGVFFIRKIMDDVVYERRSGHNHLRMSKRLPNVESQQSSEGSEKRVTIIDTTNMMRIMKLNGQIDSAASDELEKVFSQNLDQGHRLLILDMSGVGYISSRGLRMLVAAWKRARDAKGDLVLAGLQPGVGEVIKLLGFDLVFTVFESLDAATAHYSA